LGLGKEDAEQLFLTYHSRVPFVKQLTEQAMKTAGDNGHVRTILGRKCRFNTWEPNMFRVGPTKALSRDEAEKEYGRNIKRAWTYKALNKLIQGSAADQTKKAMLDLYKEGYIPHIQVHDELNLSITEDQIKPIKEIMENCLELKVPSKVDEAKGDSWGKIKK